MVFKYVFFFIVITIYRYMYSTRVCKPDMIVDLRAVTDDILRGEA